MGSVERKERQKESLRQAILDTAREILLTKGYNSLSMRSIAKRIEYSPTTIYLYFRNKGEIIHHLIEEAFAHQFETMKAAGSREQSPLMRLRAVSDAYIRFGLSEPDRYKIIYMADISQYMDTERLLEQDRIARSVRELVYRSVNDVLTASGSQADPECVFQAIWANCHGIVSLMIGRPDFPWVEREKLIETSLDITLKGFAG